jgi:hypothetical protein
VRVAIADALKVGHPDGTKVTKQSQKRKTFPGYDQQNILS